MAPPADSPRPAASRRAPLWRYLLGALLFSAVAIGMAEMLVRGIALRTDGTETTAQVTETRRGRRGRCEVRYRFQPPGRQGWQTHTDIFVHSETAAIVPRPAWDQARRAGVIRVVYWPRYPAFNEPAAALDAADLICPSIGVALMGVAALMGWAMFFDAIRGRRVLRQLEASDAIVLQAARSDPPTSSRRATSPPRSSPSSPPPRRSRLD